VSAALLVVRVGHPQQLADDGHRDQVGEVGDQVDLSRFREGLDQVIDHALDVRAQAGDHLWTEGP
jgi:hypothetical protein